MLEPAHADAAPRSLSWKAVARRAPLWLVGAGILVRAVHLLAWDVPKGFDFTEHWKYILFLLSTGHVPLASDSLPPAVFHALHIGDGAFRASYHPPLFYLLGSRLVPDALHPLALFRTPEMIPLARRVAWVSVAAGSARLVLLERFLALAFPGDSTTLPRSLAVGLAALLPCALRMDQTVSPESLVATLIALVLFLCLLSLRTSGGRRQLLLAATAGVAAGLALLAKYTGLVGVGVVGAAYGGQLLLAPERRRVALLSLATSLACALLVAGWYYQRNHAELGKVFPDSYDYSLSWERARVRATHRSLSWYVPFQPAVLWQPVWSDFWKEHPNYWSQMYATAWGDYYSTRYIAHDLGDHVVLINGRGISRLGLATMVAVMWLALLPTIALFAGLWSAIRRALRMRAEAWRLELPALACAFGALAVAFVNTVKNAIESDGPTKSEYALAATPILCVVAGFALAAALRRWPRLRLLIIGDLALLAVVIVAQSVVL